MTQEEKNALFKYQNSSEAKEHMETIGTSEKDLVEERIREDYYLKVITPFYAERVAEYEVIRSEVERLLEREFGK